MTENLLSKLREKYPLEYLQSRGAKSRDFKKRVVFWGGGETKQIPWQIYQKINAIKDPAAEIWILFIWYRFEANI